MSQNNWTDLHAHTTFSMLDGYGLSEQVIERAKQLGRTAMAITDHGSMTGHPSFERAALAAGIKPIFGEEFYVCSDIEENTQKKSHLTVLAKNQKGYSNLVKLASESYRLGFYYKPTIDGALLKQYGEGLIIMSGCTLSPTSKMILAGEHDEAESSLKAMRAQWGDDFYLEVQPTDFVDCQTVNTALKKIAKKNKMPLVVTNDVHYPMQGQHDIRKLLWSIRDRKRVSEIDEMSDTHFQLSYEQLLSCAELGQIEDVIKEAAENTLRIADKCNVTLQKASLLQFPLPEEWSDKEDYLKHLILEGLRYRGLLDKEEYKERAQYEFGLIQEKSYSDYFLIISDMVLWAKSNGILVGPARGSSAGSLICYCLRITEVDPLQYGLIFERFIDISRMDLPDIDIDFEDEKRHLVKEYLRDKYGQDHVATLSTFTTFKGKNSLDETGKSYGIPAGDVAVVKGLLLTRASADARADATIEDTLEMFPQAKDVAERYPDIRKAVLLEGQYKNMSTHAAGVVISNEPLDAHIPLYWRDGEALAGYDYDGCTYMGLVKVDILGLTALTRIRMMLEKLDMSAEDLYALPLDDELTLGGFRDMDLLGIFQFEGDSTYSVLQQMADITGFNELADVNALSRPGPLYGGSTSFYISNRRLAEEDKKRQHPLLDAYTFDTQYQILYQEQILKICREVGDLSWKDTSDLRKAMSRSLGLEFFNKYREAFSEGAIRLHGVSKQQGMEIYDMMESFGAWAFNRSHSVSYALVGYWMMWFKQHHPHMFYWSMVKKEHEELRQRQYLREYLGRGGIVTGPRINDSEKDWALSGKYGGLLAGFLSIDGIGEKCAEELVRCQPYQSMEDMEARVNKRIVNVAKRAALDTANVYVDTISSDEDFLGIRAEGEAFARQDRTHKIIEMDFGPMLKNITVVGRLKERNLKNIFESGNAAKRLKFNPLTNEMEVQPVKDPHLEEWVNMTIEDETGAIICGINRWTYPKMRDKVWNLSDGDLVSITGDKAHNYKKINITSFKKVKGGLA